MVCKSEFDSLNGDDDYLNFMFIKNSKDDSLENSQSSLPSLNNTKIGELFKIKK